MPAPQPQTGQADLAHGPGSLLVVDALAVLAQFGGDPRDAVVSSEAWRILSIRAASSASEVRRAARSAATTCPFSDPQDPHLRCPRSGAKARAGGPGSTGCPGTGVLAWGDAHGRALSRSLPRAVFTSGLFSTGNNRDNQAAVRAVGKDQLDLVGMAVYGPRNVVDKVLKGARMHP
ncbi:DUF2000 family protein [Streptomyces sp. NPDC056831]|uniref:DUF2000 family protein n=1 Tax=Streptomyces sp. NPDC056831 TaxID=3345954 RepID=UPI0036BF7A21